ncbi:MAG TPA: HD domain-containing protein [Gammaproteobacteria bacterium]|nr:HD domain-containing protein [Gammaproteobacteria bacterium]
MTDFRARRSDFDVTNTVRVSSPSAVAKAVCALYGGLYPGAAVKPLERAFADFEQLFRGEHPEFHGCDTEYHDLLHSLDVALALARHVDGHERTSRPAERLGAKRAAVGIVTALYHDVGYLRHVRDSRHRHGAEYTSKHVSRGGDFLNAYLERLGLGSEARVARRMIQFTGYEKDIRRLDLGDYKYNRLGHLIGTADLTAQMADRCYLEKCRDRLFPEFVMGGMAERTLPDGKVQVLYSSAQELLKKTPDFFTLTLRERLDGVFGGAYRYAASHFGGQNLYMESVRRNLKHLEFVLHNNAWSLLRRKPPLFTAATLKHGADCTRLATDIGLGWVASV